MEEYEVEEGMENLEVVVVGIKGKVSKRIKGKGREGLE
jgi:hypothetical protein